MPPGCLPARVARVDRGRLTVLTDEGEQRVVPGSSIHASELAGPAVGDWVALRGELAVAVLPRRSAFVRTVAGRTSAAQVIAANLDVVLVVDALTGNARVRRVERYLAVAWGSGATPVVVLTKADLCDDVAAAVEAVREDALGVDVLPVSSVTGDGLVDVRALLGSGRTAAMVGPSGVGRSSLANALAGRAVAGTREIRDDGRGRHTTTARAAPVAGWRPARGHPRHARAGALRRRRRGGHRLRRRHVDARARAEERARLRTLHRAYRAQPDRLR
jgi:ribosome biogenesis GTPase